MIRGRMARLLAVAGLLTAPLALGAPPPASAAPPDAPATQVRIALDRTLAEHAFLVIQAMRTGIDEDPEFAVAAAVLEENTVQLVDLVKAAYGAGAAVAFGQQWRNHIAYLVDYTRAQAHGDTDTSQLATAQLLTYVADFGALLAAANPGLPPDVVKGLVAEHVAQLKQIGSLAEQDFGKAYPTIRETYAHMFMIGDGLTTGIVDRFGDKFTGRSEAFSPATDLRIALHRLLGEHTYLAAIAMRARLKNASDLQAAVGALESNSAELSDSIGTIYGADAGAAFGRLWRAHTGYYLDYVDAVASHDSAAAQTALAGLATYRSDFSSFLAGANPFLDAKTLQGLLAIHTKQLVDQVDVYAAGNYRAAYETLREAYDHTAMLAAGLAGAIADQFPQRFPDASTAGPMDPSPLDGAAAILLAVAALLAGQTILDRCHLATSRLRSR